MQVHCQASGGSSQAQTLARGGCRCTVSQRRVQARQRFSCCCSDDDDDDDDEEEEEEEDDGDVDDDDDLVRPGMRT